MEFYNVKTRQKVDIPESQIKKQRIERETNSGVQYRYAAIAEQEGTRLFKFISEDTYKSLNVPEAK